MTHENVVLEVASEPPPNVTSGTLPPLQPAQVEEVQRAEIHIGLSVYLLRRKYTWTTMGCLLFLYWEFLSYKYTYYVLETTPEQDLWSLLEMMGLIGFVHLLFAMFEGFQKFL